MRVRAAILLAVAAPVAAAGCGGGEGLPVSADRAPATATTTAPPVAAPGDEPFEAAIPPAAQDAAELSVEQVVTLLRQGRIQTANLIEGAGVLTGLFDRGSYRVGTLVEGGTLLSRLASAMADAGVVLRTHPAGAPYPRGLEITHETFSTILRQGRVRSATLVERTSVLEVTGPDGQLLWTGLPAGTGTALSRLTSAMEDAGVALEVVPG